jgi:hypothetical protein
MYQKIFLKNIEAFCCLPNNSSTLTANFLGTAIGTGLPEKSP